MAINQINPDGSLRYPKADEEICSEHFHSGYPSDKITSKNYAPTLFNSRNKDLEDQDPLDLTWKFKNLKEFLTYQCPDCDFQSKEQELFLCHIVKTHSGARNFIKTQPEIMEEVIKLAPIIKDSMVQPLFVTKEEKKKKTEEEARTCEYCNFVSATSKQNLIHSKKCSMKCQDCDYTNGKSMFVRRHSHTVHGKFRPGTNILCDYCGTFFYSYSLFRLHKEKYHFGIEEARNCICDECGKAFRTKQKLMMHKHRAHQHVSMRTCHVCDIVYPNAAKAYKHYQLNHPNVECPIEVDDIHVFKCSLCDRIWEKDLDLYNHLKKGHKLTGKALNQVFPGFTTFDVKANVITNAKYQEANYVCDKCDKAFVYHGTLKKHLAVCQEDGTSLDAMRNHEANQENSLRCDHCSKVFKAKKYLSRHIRYSTRCKNMLK